MGATAATGVTLSLDDGPVQESEAIAPLLIAGAAGLAAGSVAGIAYGKTIGGPDGEEVADALDWQFHVDEFTRAREDRLMLDSTLSSLKRDVQLVENKAREEAIFKVYEAGVDNLTESDATANAQAAVDDAYATVQRSIYNSYNIRANRMANVLGVFGDTPSSNPWGDNVNQNHENVSYTGWWYVMTGGSYATADAPTTTVTLYDDDSVSYLGTANTTDGNGNNILTDPAPSETTLSNYGDANDMTGVVLNKPDPANYDSVTEDDALDVSYNRVVALDLYQWAELLQDLDDAYNAMSNEVSTIVDSYFQPAKDGEIDLYEAVGPKHLTDSASVADDYAEAALSLRAMGFPMSEQVVTIEIPTEDGEGMELTGRLSWTAHKGNSLEVGQQHNPANIPGSIMAAVNLPDDVTSLYENETNTTSYSDSEGPGAETLELTQPFTIVSAEGASGVTFNDRSLANDSMTNDQINQIFKENYTANKEATEMVHDTATGGGGGWSGLSTGEKGVALVVAALAALGVINN